MDINETKCRQTNRETNKFLSCQFFSFALKQVEDKEKQTNKQTKEHNREANARIEKKRNETSELFVVFATSGLFLLTDEMSSPLNSFACYWNLFACCPRE